MSPRFEPISGRYLHLELLGRPHRVYVEEAGEGIPLLCLHTAGSDTRQFRGLMNDQRITANFRVLLSICPGTANLRRRQAGMKPNISSPRATIYA